MSCRLPKSSVVQETVDLREEGRWKDEGRREIRESERLVVQ